MNDSNQRMKLTWFCRGLLYHYDGPWPRYTELLTEGLELEV